MPEAITRLIAEPTLPPGERDLGARLRISVLPRRASVRVQLSTGALGAAAAIRIGGVPLPLQPNRWAGGDPVIAWVAPDAWLLQSAGDDGAELATTARNSCQGVACAVTDLSDALATLALEGVDAPAVLARGCGLDLSAQAFGAGACARTRLAQWPVVVRRAGEARFELIVDRSVARYLHDWLGDAAVGLV